MRIVVISYHYPPDPAVGGLRAAKVAEAFRRAGHGVHVVAAQVPEASVPLVRTPGGIVIERVRAWRNPRELWLAWKRRGGGVAATGAAKAPPAEASAALPVRVPTWKRMIFSALWLPDDHQGFAPAAAAAARRAFPEGVDLVYTTAPPFSGHLAGLWLSWRRGVRWIAEFRDPWTDNAWKPAHVRSAWSDAVERWLERQTLDRAERIVAVSEGIARLFRAKLPPDASDRVLLIRNGIEWLAPPGARPPAPGPKRVVHVGSFYFGRDPRLFLAALAQVVARHRLGPADLQVDLVGRCRWYNGVSVEAEVSRLGLDGLVHFQDWVPHEACQGIVRGADVLLLLAQQQPDQVPNKLYEYLGTRAPILAFADDAGETAAMLREAGGHILVTGTDPEAATRGIEEALGLAAEPRVQPDDRRLRAWTTEGQMDHLLTALGG